MKQRLFSDKSNQRGVVLVEAMVAIVIFSVGVLAVVGLQASMLKNTSDSKYRAEASFLAQQRVGMMWADITGTIAGNYVELTPVSLPELPLGFRTTTQTPLVLPSGTGVESVITITWQLPGEVQHNYTTTASIFQNSVLP